MSNNKDPLIKIFAARMKEARELCNLTREQASIALGYENTSYLSKLEKGEHLSGVRSEIVIKAAKLYEVSADFLLGLSDEWERDPVLAQEKHIEGWLISQSQKSLARELNMIRKMGNKIATIETSVNEILPAAKQCHAAFLNFTRLNPTFEEEMRGGSSLQAAIFGISDRAIKAERALRRHHIEIRQVNVNMPIFDFADV